MAILSQVSEVTFATGAKFSLYTFFMAVINPLDEVIIPNSILG